MPLRYFENYELVKSTFSISLLGCSVSAVGGPGDIEENKSMTILILCILDASFQEFSTRNMNRFFFSSV